MLEAIATLRRGGTAVDIGGMMERPGLDLFAMMCSQISVIGSLWFSTGEAQDMAALAGAGVLDLSRLEHHTFPLSQVNEALDNIPERHGGFTNLGLRPGDVLARRSILLREWNSFAGGVVMPAAAS